MEDRVIRIEERLGFHEREIAEIKEFTSVLANKLDGIVKTLAMIRNILIGAVAFAAAEQTGVLKLLMKIF